jgi:ring-1,2-phenylacetyl-CoA epoxidase subunit PaaE
MNVFEKLTVRKVQSLTFDSKKVEFHLPQGLKSKFKFQPGQYITIKKNFNNIDERRSYSICSSNNDPLAIGVKRVEDGLFSNYIFNELRPGMVLEVMSPNGRFVQKKETNFLMVAAGSGITPIISIISSTLRSNNSSRFTLVYGNKTTESIMFYKELGNLKDAFLGQLNIVHILSKQTQDVDLLNGRIDQDKMSLLISKKAIDLDVDGVFICGPGSMINTVSNVLFKEGFDKSKIYSEKFYLGDVPNLKQTNKAKITNNFRSNIEIILDGSRRTFTFNETDNNIIDAAQSNGIGVPFSCKGGMCCTCRCKITKGDVKMIANYSLEDWEMEAGFILACQAVPQTKDIVLDFDAS